MPAQWFYELMEVIVALYQLSVRIYILVIENQALLEETLEACQG